MWGKRTKRKKRKGKETKKREELESVGGVKGRKITGADGMYVRGVAVVASVDIDRSMLCLLCLLRVRNTVLRCAAGKITIDPKAHLPY